MNITEFTDIYLTYLKRKPTISDINAHIKKDKNLFINEILNCKEYANLISIISPNPDLLNNLNTMKFKSGYGLIFIHNSSLHYTNQYNIYANITLTCPSYYENKWHSILAITQDNKIISNSNTFYWENAQNLEKNWTVQNDHNKIYDRIVYTYHFLKNSNINNRVHIDQECFLLANPHTCVNSGHELSIIFDSVDYIRKHNIQKIVIFNYAYKYPNNLNLLKLLVPEDKLLFIKFNVIYQFKKIHIIKQELHNICKHQYLIDELKYKIMAKYPNPTKYKNKKIIMIKNIRNLQVARCNDQFICEKLFKELSKRDYVIINPEEMNIFELAILLLNAKIIISSYGGILYTNQIFFGMSAEIYIMCLFGTNITSYYKIISRTKEVIQLPDKNLDMRSDLTTQLLVKFV